MNESQLIFRMDDEKIVKKLERVKKVMKSIRRHLSKAIGDTETWDAAQMKRAKHTVGGMTIRDLKSISIDAMKGARADMKDIQFKRRDLRAAMTKRIMFSLGGNGNASRWSSEDIIK